ncbi:MAG: hypothetical protein GY765_35080 [bacterium]|nr:hypothetical protein [bacterium]
MWQYIISGLVILLVFLAVILGKPGSNLSEDSYKEDVYTRFISDGKLQRGDIETMLNSLPESPGRDLQLGAMCYKVAFAKIDKGTYVCPKCGEKTIYSADRENFPGDIDKFIPEFRRLAQQIKGIDAKLVETEFCKKCSPDCTAPNLSLDITLPGETAIRTIKHIQKEDLQLLVEFTNGEVVHQASQGREVMMKDYTNRLKALLGVTVPPKK